MKEWLIPYFIIGVLISALASHNFYYIYKKGIALWIILFAFLFTLLLWPIILIAGLVTPIDSK